MNTAVTVYLLISAYFAAHTGTWAAYRREPAFAAAAIAFIAWPVLAAVVIYRRIKG